MVSFRFKHVFLESFAVHLPPHEVSSAEIEDKLGEIYARLQIPFGTLERLSGVSTRYFWDREIAPSDVATIAAQKALEQTSIDPKHIQALFSCSVTRDYFEPAVACLVHRRLNLPEAAMVLDISNACIGFSDGIVMLANLIETGVVKAGVVVSGEQIARTLDYNFEFILGNKEISREDLIRLLPTYTLGSGAVAFVMCHESLATKPHRVVGAVSRAATQHCDLCNGNGDFFYKQAKGFHPIMYTESSKLIASAATLGGRMWKDATQVLDWSREDVDHIFCHQVGKQVNDAFYKEMGLDIEKEFTIYKKYGNLVSAALPSAFVLGMAEKDVKPKDKILLTAFGSGLNSIFTGIEW